MNEQEHLFKKKVKIEEEEEEVSLVTQSKEWIKKKLKLQSLVHVKIKKGDEKV